MKRALYSISFVAVLLLAGVLFLGARGINQERIAELEDELTRMRSSRDSIQTVVAYKDSLQRLLRERIAERSGEVDDLREEREEMERERERQEMAVRRLDSFEDVEKKFLDTFPELGTSTRVAEVDRNGFAFTYIMMPLAAVETFVLDHQDRLSLQDQRDLLLRVDALQSTIGVLKDSLVVLEAEKSAAYQTGYDDAYAQYENLNQEYVGYLKQPPRVSLFSSNRTAFISGAAGLLGGVGICAVANR